MGRQSEFTQEIADVICERIALGESLRSITADSKMPAQSTVFKWLTQQPAFAEQYARARETQADTLADQIVEIADHSRKGTKTTTKANGDVETVEVDMVERARLQIDARKWMASKLAPKKYGEKLQTELSGHLSVSAREMTDAELEAIAAGSGG